MLNSYMRRKARFKQALGRGCRQGQQEDEVNEAEKGEAEEF